MSTEPQSSTRSAGSRPPTPAVRRSRRRRAAARLRGGPPGQRHRGWGSAGRAAALPHHTIRPTRISGLWVAVAFFAVVLLLLLIFILQNAKTVDIAYFGAHGHLPLGVALLLSAVCGVLLTMLAGAARISQLRAVARRHRRADGPSARRP